MGLQRWAGRREKFFRLYFIFKYAVFDIKPTYNHEIIIPGVHLHSLNFFIWGAVRADFLLGAVPPLLSLLPLEPPLLGM